MSLPSICRIGAYEIVSILGKGGVGEVYRATDTNLTKAVNGPCLFALALRRLVRMETGASVLYAGSSNSGPGYDVFPDGQFAVVRTPDPRDAREIVVVQNWFDELTHLAPAK